MENKAGLLFWKNKYLQVRSEGVWRRFLSEKKGKVISSKRTKDRKSMGTNSRKSGTKNLEAESIRNRMESMGRHAMLKTVIEIRWSLAHNTFIAESVYLALNSLWDWDHILSEQIKKRQHQVP